MNIINLTMQDSLIVHALHFPCDNPKAVVQIIHGLKEHKQRYVYFSKFLQNNGYAVIVSDNRGHALSVNENFPLGHMETIELMVSDQYEITSYAKKLYPNTPVYMLGHSFGSMIARNYIQSYDDELSKLVLSGTVGYDPLVFIPIFLGNIIIKFQGRHGKSKLLKMLLGVENGDTSWVCGNKEVMEEYKKDPFCSGYTYTNQAMHTIFNALKRLHNFQAYKCKNPDMPILSIVGELDPVTKGKKGIKDSENTLKKAGYKNVTTIVYKDMKHEVLNEIGKELVYQDVLSFLDR